MAKIRDIADVSEFPNVFLSSTPNFLQITPKPATNTQYHARLTVAGSQSVAILTAQGDTYTLTPTSDIDEVSGLTFYVSADAQETALNVVEALRNVEYLRANHKIYALPNSNVVNIKSVGTNPNYANLTLTTGYALETVSTATHSNSILGATATDSDILCEVYAGASEFLGQAENTNLGEYSHTLSKAYTGTGVIEFNLSTLRPLTFEYAQGIQGWQAYNSLLKYKLFVKFARDRANVVPFYVSPPLYMLVAPDRLGNELLSEKISGQFARLLTSKPDTWQTLTGGVEYFSVLYSDEFYGLDSYAGNIELCIAVQDGTGEVTREYSALKTLQTFPELCTLGADTAGILEAYPDAVQLEMYLTRDRVRWSESRLIHILATDTPRETVEFINEFGVLDTFHFCDNPQIDYKTQQTEFQKIATRNDPTTTRRTDVKAPVTVALVSVSAPDDVAKWLQHLAESPAVWYNGRLLTSAEVSVSTSDENRDLQTVNMKLTWEQ